MQVKVGAWRLEAHYQLLLSNLASSPGRPGLGWLLPGRLAAAALGAGIEVHLAPIVLMTITIILLRIWIFEMKNKKKTKPWMETKTWPSILGLH